MVGFDGIQSKQKLAMTERKRRKLSEIDQEISVCKANLSLSEGKIIGSFTRGSASTADSSMSTPIKDSSVQKDEVILFIKNLNKLRDTLQQKNAILESESDRNVAVLESEVTRLSKQLKTAQEWQRKAKEGEERVKVLTVKVEDLQGKLSKKLAEQNQQLSHYRRENAEVKLQVKNLKADNKVIMTHLDRLNREIKEGPQNKPSTLQQRQLRVMRSLYQQTLPNIESRESQRRTAELEEPRYKIAADEASERNGQLKAVVRRMQEEIELLRREKELLMKENRQKHLNLQNQKQLVAMAEQEKARQDSLIHKMGDKIMSLEQINQTLRESAANEDVSETEESYYRTTRSKAGQFYYRK